MKKSNFRGIPTQSLTASKDRGLGPGSAGQSGDNQGLSQDAEADSESVEELVEEGQSAEASAIAGIEQADSEDPKPVRTKQFREDDVPPEYQDIEP